MRTKSNALHTMIGHEHPISSMLTALTALPIVMGSQDQTVPTTPACGKFPPHFFGTQHNCHNPNRCVHRSPVTPTCLVHSVHLHTFFIVVRTSVAAGMMKIGAYGRHLILLVHDIPVTVGPLRVINTTTLDNHWTGQHRLASS